MTEKGVHKSILVHQAMTIPGAQAAVDKKWEKLEKLPVWHVTKVKRVMEKARKEGRTVLFATIMDSCHLKNSELEPKVQNYEGRVALRGDIVKDDSDSYVVFTEQGSWVKDGLEGRGQALTSPSPPHTPNRQT